MLPIGRGLCKALVNGVRLAAKGRCETVQPRFQFTRAVRQPMIAKDVGNGTLALLSVRETCLGGGAGGIRHWTSSENPEAWGAELDRTLSGGGVRMVECYPELTDAQIPSQAQNESRWCR